MPLPLQGCFKKCPHIPVYLGRTYDVQGSHPFYDNLGELPLSACHAAQAAK